MTRPTVQRALLLAGAALYALLAVHFVNYAPDDIYITLRYAANAAQGLGPVFNAGEAVEGFSNPLFLGWLTALQAGLDGPRAMVAAAKLTGLAAGLLALLLTAALARRDEEGAAYWGLAPLLVGLSGYFAFWCASGMETGLHALLVLVAVGLFARSLETHRKAWRVLAGLAFGLTAISRPEGAIFLVAALLARALLLRRDGRRPDVADAGFVGLALAPIIVYFLWRHATYGLWWPNTFYAKAGGGLGTYADGVRYLLLAVGPALWGNVLLAPLLLTGLVPWQKASPRTLVLLTAIAAQAGFVVIGGGDWMPGWRFVVPIVAPLALLAPAIVARWRGVLAGRWIAEWTPFWRVALIVALLLPAAAHLYDVKQLSHAPSGWSGYRDDDFFAAPYVEVAQWLNEHAQAGDWLATGEAGLIPYLTGLPTIDCFGLTDAHLARVPGKRHEKVDPDYILGREPRFVVIGGARLGPDGVSSDFAYGNSLLGHPRFVDEYEPALRHGSFLVYSRRSQVP